MLKLCRVTKVKVLFLVLVFVFNFDLFKFSATILEKGLLGTLTVTTSSVNESMSLNDIASYKTGFIATLFPLNIGECSQ